MDELAKVAGQAPQDQSAAIGSLWPGRQKAGQRAEADGSAQQSQRTVRETEMEAMKMMRDDDISQRSGGVVLLRTITGYCSTQKFEEGLKPWMTALIEQFDRPGSEVHEGVAKVVRELIHRASLVPKLATTVQPFVGPIVDKVLKAEAEWQPASLECLDMLIRSYPTHCLSDKEKIINTLLVLLDISESETQMAVAECMASVPSIGGDGGNAALNQAEVWQIWCNMLLATLSDTLDKIASPLGTVQTPLLGVSVPLGSKFDPSNRPEPPDKFPLQEPTETEPDRSALLMTRSRSLCLCMQQLLQTAYPVAVTFPYEAIMTVCCRMLALTRQQLVSHPSLACILLFTAMPAFYSSALNLLTAYVSTCRQRAFQGGWLINQLLLQVFEWTGSDSPDHTHSTPYSSVRVDCYKLMKVWCSVMRGGLDGATAMHFVHHIVHDAIPVRKEHKVEMVKTGSEKEKGASKAGPSVPQTPTVLSEEDVKANHDLTFSALDGLSSLMQCCGAGLLPEQHAAAQGLLLPVIMEVNMAEVPSSATPLPKGWWTDRSVPQPYGRADCRKALYSALESCIVADSNLTPVPLHHAMVLFSQGTNDPNIEVSTACHRALAICRMAARARVPSVAARTPSVGMPRPTMPMSARETRKTDGEEKKGEGDGEETAMETDETRTPRPRQVITMEQSLLQQQKILGARIRAMTPGPRSAPATATVPTGAFARSTPKIAELSVAVAGTESIYDRRRKTRQNSVPSNASPCEEQPNSSSSSSAIATASSTASASSKTESSPPTSEVATATKTARRRESSESVSSTGDADVEVVEVEEPAAKRPRPSAPTEQSSTTGQSAAVAQGTAATDQSTMAVQSKTADQSTTKVSEEVSSIMGSFVDSGPDSDDAT